VSGTREAFDYENLVYFHPAEFASLPAEYQESHQANRIPGNFSRGKIQINGY